VYWYDWKAIQDCQKSAAFLSYRIQTVEVRGKLSDITELFVRINSTGKALTHSEKLHAKYFKKPFMREAQRLAKKCRRYFENEDIVSPAQVERMKDVELVSELLVSLSQGGLIHKKVAVDKAVGGESINAHTLTRISGEFTRVLGLLRRVLPKQKVTKGAGPEHQLFASYLISTQQSTDSLGQRQHRAEILRGVFSGLFEKKDEQRIFSPEQRRLLWNSDAERRCECGHQLSWSSFQVDHHKAHAHGGPTVLENARLLCPKCNKAKGAKVVKEA
jgi:HNH endonuclease